MRQITNLILLIILMFGLSANAQIQNKNLDFILLVNDKVYNQYGTFKFVRFHNGNSYEVKANYWPGNLTIRESDYNQIVDATKTDSLYLHITDDRYIDGKLLNDQYTIKYQGKWLQDTYNILRIYNLNNKEYKQRFANVSKGKNYVYELDSPQHTFLLIRNN